MSLIIDILTINDEPKDFDYLFKLWHKVNQNRSEVILNFSKCYFLKPNAVAFLGGLIRLIESRGNQITVKWNTLHDNVGMNLQQNGFLYNFGANTNPWQGNSVPYREDREQNRDILVDYLQEQWLGRGWVNIGQYLKMLIVSKVWEIYDNAFVHGKTDIGVFSCGQYFPKLNELQLTVVDFGIGIPHNVRNFLEKADFAADKALEWAFQSGTTTRRGEARGIGLDLLRNFVKKNKGKLEIFSHDGYVKIDNSREEYTIRENFFEGTLVNITLLCDESCYFLDSLSLESDKEPLFKGRQSL